MNDNKPEMTNEEKRTRLIVYLILIGVSLLFVALVTYYSLQLARPDTAINAQFYAQQGMAAPSSLQQWMVSLSDGFFAVGAVLTGVGCLTWVSSTGFFDMLFYGFSSLKTMVMPFKAPKKPKPFYDYKVEREAKRKSPVNSALIVGLVYIALAVLFTVLFYMA